MRRRLTLLTFVLAAPLAAQNPPDSKQTVATPVSARRLTTPADARRILSALADDSMQGRATGTVGAHRAAQYIASQMKRLGLTSLGDSGFFQKVPVSMDTSRTYPVTRIPDPANPGRTINKIDSSNGPRIRVSPRARPSFAALDTIPPARRRTEVNVLGVIRGSDPILKDEVILVDAHYDHIGIITAVNGDSIANGADDDASGVTAVLEIARQIKEGPPPKRTIVFAAMIGEEVGLIGTNWFIQHPAIPLERIVANLEIEMIDRPDSLSYGAGKAWLTGFERSTMGEIFQAGGLQVFPDARPSQSFFTRSDNIGFARRGIVAHTLSSFNLHTDYHRVTDEVRGADFQHMAAVINLGARAVRLLADGPKPEWKPGGQPQQSAGRGRGGR